MNRSGRPPSVAGIHFSADDRWLVAATRGSSQSRGPTLLFEVAVTPVSVAARAGRPADGLTSVIGPVRPEAVVEGGTIVARPRAALTLAFAQEVAAPQLLVFAEVLAELLAAV